MVEYLEFELLIGAASATGYLVTVVKSPAGEGEAYCQLDLDEPQRAIVQALETSQANADQVLALGSYLFDALFVGDLLILYRTSLGLVRQEGQGLRLRLRISPPALAVLPWEYLYDRMEAIFLATALETALVRHVALGLVARSSAAQLPLRILAVIANPHDLAQLNVVQEKALLQEAAAHWVARGFLELRFLEQATVSNISQTMRTFQPHIVHFVGHGMFDGERALILLEDENGAAIAVDEDVFQGFFNDATATRLVVLNACQSATLSSSQPLAGLASRLLQRQLAGVVAMQYPISDRAALVFVREFYRSLAERYPLDAAVAVARKGIYQELGGDLPEWGTPVLFLRAADGVLVEIPAAASSVSKIPAPPAPERPVTQVDFVGRDHELAAYGQQLQTSGVAVITGMAGVGKTALAVMLAQRVAAPQQVFWHTFHADEDANVLVWDLAGFLAQQGQGELWEILQSARQSGSQPPPLTTLVDYLLQNLEGRTYLLCLDDFHFVADDPALADFMECLLRLVAGNRLMVISTLRHVPEFLQTPTATVLGGLSLADTETLLQKQNLALDPALITALHANTEGNAQFLTLAIDALKRTRTPDRLIERLAEADSIERYLLRELDEGLNDEERALLEAVAVLLGYPGTRAAIEAVLEGGRIRRTLRALCDRHLISVSGDEPDQTYALHVIVRAFYYEELAEGPKRTMHRRAGTYYEQEEVDLLKAARHFVQAQAYEHAAELVTQDIWALVNRGEVRPLQAILATFKQAQLSAPTWLQVNLARGDLYTFTRDRVLAEAGYQVVLTQLDQPNGAGMLSQAEKQLLRARACRGMADLLEQETPKEAVSWLQSGLATLDSLDVDEVKVYATEKAIFQIKLSNTYFVLGDYAASLTAAQAGLALLPPEPGQWHINAFVNLGYICFNHQGDTSGALQKWQHSLDICQQLGLLFRKLPILINLGIAHYYNGDWNNATLYYQEALTLAEQLGNVTAQASAANSLGSLYTNRGEYALAQASFMQASQLARRYGLREELVYTLAGHSVLLIEEENWALAESTLQEALALALELQIKYPLPEIYRGWAQLSLARGELQQSLTFAEKSQQTAEEINARIELGISRRVLGQIKLALGKKEEAYQEFAYSLDLLAQEVPYETARTQWTWGTHLLTDKNDECAQVHLSKARIIFEKLGVTTTSTDRD